MKTKKEDHRGMTHAELAVIRKTAVNLVKKGKLSPEKVIELMDLSRNSIYKRLKLYKEWWEKALEPKKWKWWRPKKDDSNLTDKEIKSLIKVLDCEPRKCKQLHLDFWLRTIKVIQYTIRELFGKDLTDWKVRDLIIEIGYTNQKPLFRAYQQNPEKVIERVETRLPAIKLEAETENREIYYWDEAWFKSTDQRWKTRAKRWKTPIVRVTWARFSINAISCISSKWVLRFMAYRGWFTWETLIEFLKKLIYKSDKKITLILDGHPTHKSKAVQKYLESINDQIKLYYLPWYSPELNPDEQVWNQVKIDLKGRIVVSLDDMIDKVKRSLYRLQKQKDKVWSYFRHPEVKYM